ncbi:hypothetical protein BCR39DRAFT_505572 [Naematelia encephala]|uniref:Uncharacterized protein n=1 Tax=Naematelia encephala TaxID=71784 RepID=A0A1Y2B3N1_9TREE|nr:hypothetical protein BCR39DRAFT_505572 [Naematelia encephala]
MLLELVERQVERRGGDSVSIAVSCRSVFEARSIILSFPLDLGIPSLNCPDGVQGLDKSERMLALYKTSDDEKEKKKTPAGVTENNDGEFPQRARVSLYSVAFLLVPLRSLNLPSPTITETGPHVWGKGSLSSSMKNNLFHGETMPHPYLKREAIKYGNSGHLGEMSQTLGYCESISLSTGITIILLRSNTGHLIVLYKHDGLTCILAQVGQAIDSRNLNPKVERT